MFKRWFESRTLSVLQVHYGQPLKKPLPDFERHLLRGAVNLTQQDGGTAFDAAARFYVAYAETAVRQGRDLNEINIGGVMGRMFGLKDRMRFFPEHKAALARVLQDERERRADG